MDTNSSYKGRTSWTSATPGPISIVGHGRLGEASLVPAVKGWVRKHFGLTIEPKLTPALNCSAPMNDHPYVFLAMFLGVAVAFPLILLSIARLWFRFFQPAKPSPTKNDVYECGVASTGDSWIQFKAHYY